MSQQNSQNVIGVPSKWSITADVKPQKDSQIVFSTDHIADPLTALLQSSKVKTSSSDNGSKVQQLANQQHELSENSSFDQLGKSSAISNGWEMTIGNDLFGEDAPTLMSPCSHEKKTMARNRQEQNTVPITHVSTFFEGCSTASAKCLQPTSIRQADYSSEQQDVVPSLRNEVPPDHTTIHSQATEHKPNFHSSAVLGTPHVDSMSAPVATTKLEHHNTETQTAHEKKRHHIKLGSSSHPSGKDNLNTSGGPRGSTGSSFSSFTQNIFGHAREIGSLAKTAASTLLSTAAANARNSLMNDLDPQLWNDVNTIKPSTSLSCLLEEQDSSRKDKLYPFDDRFPYFGCLQYGWFKRTSPFTLDTDAGIIKCSCCHFVYGVPPTLSAHSNVSSSNNVSSGIQPSYHYAPLLPEFFLYHCFMKCRYQITSHLASLIEAELDYRHGGHLKLLPNEDILIVLVKTYLSSDCTPPILGQLMCTNYRLIFEPNVSAAPLEVSLGTQWTHLCNFWEIPLACVESVLRAHPTFKERLHLSRGRESPGEKYEASLSRRSQLQRHHHNHHHFHAQHEGLVIQITTKDNRKYRILLRETGREAQILSTLRSAVFPNNVNELYAFKIKEKSSQGQDAALQDAQCNKAQLLDPNSDDCNQDKIPNLIEYGSLVSVPSEMVPNRSCDQQINSFFYGKCDLPEKVFEYIPEKEWQYYIDISKEPGRMRLRVSRVNSDFSVCPSYPQLVVVPEIISDEMLKKIAPFRSKQRFPMFCWMHNALPSSLWRSSQPRSMFNRCVEDEQLLSYLAQASLSHTATQSKKPLLIIDARPYANACVNKVQGAGFEDTSVYYQGCRIEFANIQNIHHVRDAWNKMAAAIAVMQASTITFPSLYPMLQLSSALTIPKTAIDPKNNCPECYAPHAWTLPEDEVKSPSQSPTRLTLSLDPLSSLWVFGPPVSQQLSVCSTTYSSMLREFSTSAWYDQIQCILRASNLVAQRLSIGETVLVHCSDGWDRTAQLSGLAMICLDPYYRSIEGFITLIEQEFLHAGHQFHLRCGHSGYISCSADIHNSFKPINSRNNYPYNFPTKSYEHGTPVTSYPDNYINVEDKATIEENDLVDYYPENDLGELSSGDGSFETNNSNKSNKKESSRHLRHQRAPIFIQWLDCVYQIMQQFPAAFEFTTALLDVIAAALKSCLYGTFLLDSQRERELLDIKGRTFSLWPHILEQRELFVRSNIRKGFSSRPRHLPPLLVPEVYNLSPWLSYWFRYRPIGLGSVFKSFFESYSL